MAAAPSKPSPTNRQVAKTESSLVEGDSVAPVTADTPCCNEPSSSKPTYKSVENSPVFLLAKKHLNDGKFEEALSTLEEGLQSVQATLVEQSSGDADCSLHEAMAPFHYLYGTTLLYSIEESTDSQDMTLPSATTVDASTEGNAANPSAEEGNAVNPSAEEGKTNDPSPEGKTNDPSPEGKTNDPSPEEAPEVTDEMQIAWENFEAARSIIESMLKENQDEKLQLDLAQIFLREGDLQRMNGRYDASIQDYQSALSIRKKSTLIGAYDRKLADAHYNLALALMLQASDASKDNEAPSLPQVALRNKSVFHYLSCSKCICGQIAQLRGVEPSTILEEDDKLAKAKTSPDDPEFELPNVASAVLTALRKRARQMLASAVENRDKIDDMCELLDEIQETIDEAETSAKGVQQVSEMKAAAAAAVSAEDGSSTTIGFGPSTATASVAATPASDSAPAAAARPMMVIKKKRKANSMTSQTENKRPKPEAE